MRRANGLDLTSRGGHGPMCARRGRKLPVRVLAGYIAGLAVLAAHSSAAARVERHELGSGLSLVIAPRPGAAAVALQAWVGVGAADEPRHHAGIAHVVEHMLFKGTARRGVGELARTVESAGGDINAWTSFDDTVFHTVLARRFLDRGLDVLGDALGHSSFAEDELDREREVILEEIRGGDDDPVRAVAQNLLSTSFTRHPYRRPIIGEASVVRALSRADLVAFHRRFYTADNVTLVVAGDVEARAIAERVEHHFAGLPRGARPPRRRQDEPAQRALRAVVAARDVSESHVSLGFPLASIDSADTAALDVASVILGQGESSRLGTSLCRDEELATDAHAYVHALRDRCLFIASASAVPARFEAAVAGLGAELGRLVREEVSEGELDKARRVIEADAIYQSETVESLARKHGTHGSLTGDVAFDERYLEAIGEVTPATLRRAAERVLRTTRATVSALLPSSPGLATDRGLEVARGRIAAALERGLASGRRAAPLTPGRRAAPLALGAAKVAVPPSVVVASTLRRARLPSGVRVVIKRDPSVPLVAARAVWTGGALFETERDSGMSHLLGALLTRGCADRDAGDIIDEVDATAASLSGFSGKSSLGLRGQWLARDFEAGFDLFADCLLSPTFPERELDRERRRTLEDLEARRDSPSWRAFRLFSETLYRDHPYHLDRLGTPASIEAITRDQLVAHFRRVYPPGELTIAIVGDVDPARAFELVTERFGGLASRQRRVLDDVAAPSFAGRSADEREVYDYLEREQAQLVIGFPGLTVRDDERHALEVLTTVLGGQGGRLVHELRERQALAYQVGAFSIEGVHPGYLAVYLACSPDKLSAAVAGIRRELDRVRAAGITDDELDRAVRYLVGTHEISLQRRSAVASALAFYEAYGVGAEQHLRYADAIEAVTAADVRAIAERLIDWDLAVTASVVPPSMSPEAERRSRGTRSRPHRPRRRPR